MLLIDSMWPRLFIFGGRRSDGDDAGTPRGANAKGTEQSITVSESASRLRDDVSSEFPRELAPIAGVGQSTIIEELTRGDLERARRALASIYHEYFERLWRVAYRVLRSGDLAEEVTHDVFLALWTNRESVVIRGDIGIYLYVAVRNRAYKRQRHAAVVDRHASHVVSSALSDPHESSTPDTQLAEADAARALADALADVSERDRTVLTLRWRDGLTYDEIATALGISSVAARVAVSRQQRRLAPVLAQLRMRLRDA